MATQQDEVGYGCLKESETDKKSLKGGKVAPLRIYTVRKPRHLYRECYKCKASVPY